MSRRFFSPPVFEGDEEKTRAAELLNTVLIALTLLSTVALLAVFLGGTARPQTYIIVSAFIFVTLLMQIPMRLGYIKPVGFLAAIFFTITLTFAIISGGTVRAPGIALYTLTILISGLVISRRAAFWSAIINTIIFFILLWLEINGQLPAPIVTVNIQQGIIFAINSIFGATLLGIALRRLNESLKRAQDGEEQLLKLNTELEQRVNERTAELETVNKHTSRRAAQLQTITELSESIAQVQDLNELFPAATELISQRFGFYHVGIFLVDQDHEYAILQAANSEGGKRMLKRGHQLKLGIGVVGYCAQTGQPRIALDVGTDAIFFDNPDLPDTRSEVALPLKPTTETIGVLDVQSTEAGAFSTEDLQVLTALANQVSIALENARLLTETRAALAQVQEVYNEFTRAEWSRSVSKAEQAGFRYQTGRIEMLEYGLQDPEIITAIQSGNISRNQKKQTTVAVPVKLRGEVIGILHVESSDPTKEWQADEISLVEAVAERAAFAMENARLFQDARRRASKERLISEATSRISGVLDLENILQTTADELERVLGGSEILIQFQNKESE